MELKHILVILAILVVIYYVKIHQPQAFKVGDDFLMSTFGKIFDGIKQAVNSQTQPAAPEQPEGGVPDAIP